MPVTGMLYLTYKNIEINGSTQQKILFKTTLRGLPQFRKSIV